MIVGITVVIPLSRMKRSAACAIVRPVCGSHRKRIRSIFCSPSTSHSRGRWRRWSDSPKLVSRRQVVVEQPTRGRDPGHHPGAVLGRGREQLAAGLLLEQVVDRLHRADRARRDRAQALLAPPDRGAERDAVVADLSLGLEVLEGRERLVGLDRVHARVVQLVEVDAVGSEPPQARLEGVAHEAGVPALRALALGMLAPALAQLVAELGRDRDLVAARGEHTPDELLVGAAAVGVAGVEEADPELERLREQALAVGLGHVPPPVRAQRPGAEADLGGLEVGVAESPRPHAPESSPVPPAPARSIADAT